MNGKQFIRTITEQWIWFVDNQLELIGVKQNRLAEKMQKAYVITGDEVEKNPSGRQAIK